MRVLNSLVVLGLTILSLGARADLRNVSLFADDPFRPRNIFLMCLKSVIERDNPGLNFVSFAQTEMPYDQNTPPKFAKTDFILEDKATGKRYLHKAVLQSTDQTLGWQYYQQGSQISLFTKSMSEKVEFSRSPNRSPIIKLLSVASCPSQ